jgi:hypothetical protein
VLLKFDQGLSPQFGVTAHYPLLVGVMAEAEADAEDDVFDAEPLVAVAAQDGSIPDGCSAGAVYKQHSGMVFLDQDVVQQKWVASNITTGEQVCLDHPYCEDVFMVFDDYGMGCVACDDWDPVLVKTIFKEQVWISTEGSLVLQEMDGDKKIFTGLRSFNTVCESMGWLVL